MSVWYNLNVTAIAPDKTAVAKFFNLKDTWEEVRTDMFEFSFGGKNAPGLTFHKIAQQNPDLIFLVEQQIECDTVQWFLMRYDLSSGKLRTVLVQDSGDFNNEVNKKIWEDFKKTNAHLPADHWYFKKGNDKHRWKGYFNDFNRSVIILSQDDQYQEMLPFYLEEDLDLDFDNTPLDDQ